MGPLTDVCIVTPRLDDNSLGRTYCIWLLCRAAGWSTRILSVADSAQVWAPLRDTAFADECERAPLSDPANRDVVRRAVDEARGVMVIKAIPETFGAVAPMLLGRSNVVVDIDDPDLEAQTTWLAPRPRAGAMKTSRYWALRKCRRLVRSFDVMVSNPVLQQMYGGVVVPHVRVDRGEGRPHRSDRPRVGFVGTARKHKGIELLRDAVDRLASRGYTLDITAPVPADARPHETWHGHTSLEQGMALTAACDIVVVPSYDVGYARAQFPVKIVDAELSARAVLAAEVGPIPWALAGTGRLFEPGNVESLTQGLSELSDPALRTSLGGAARAHALRSFTLDAVLPTFTAALEPHLLARAA